MRRSVNVFGGGVILDEEESTKMKPFVESSVNEPHRSCK